MEALFITLQKDLDGSTDPQFAVEILQQVYNYLINLTDYSKIDQLLASALPLENGILGFLVYNCGKKEQEKSKLVSLQIIQWLLSNEAIETSVWPLCQRIQKVLDILWKNPRETSKVQVAALDSIILLLENFQNNVTVQDFELATLYGALLPASEKSAFTPTVRGKIFHCLGLVAAFGCGVDKFLGKEEKYMQLVRHYVTIVTFQVESNYSHMEASILLGCIRGFDKFLSAFQTKIPKECPEIKSFYDKLEKIIDPKCSIENDDQSVKLKRREFQRAGLDFVANHGTFFFDSFFENHAWWFVNLLTWAKSNNADDSRAGMRAVMKFLETVSALTEEQTQNVLNQEKMQKFLQFFTQMFTTILENKDCHRSELTVAVKGSGLLAKVCGDPNIVEQLFNMIIKQIEAIITELNMPVVDKYSGSHSLIPTYLESVGNMLLAMNTSDEESRQSFQNRLLIVENLSILLITAYPDLSEKRKPFAPKCFTAVVKGLYGRHYKYCESFLERVIHEGLTHIIASPTQAEADIMIESFNLQNANRKSNEGGKTKSVYTLLHIRTVDFYTSFWTGLIEGSRYADVQAKDKLIYNTVLEWVLKTIGKLDLSLQFLDNEDDDSDEANELNIADPAYNTKANVVKDFQLFINTVDFLRTFVKFTDAQLFEDWIELFIEKMLQYIKDHTLVSGFYRILDLVFEVTRKLNYFEASERNDILKRCCHFLESTSLKIHEFRDDLLLAILDVWLSAPDQMVLKSCCSLGETLQCVFRTGRNCFPLACRGVQAIERWFQIQDFPEMEMEKLVNRLFPSWKLYFTTKEDEPEAQIESPSSKSYKYKPKSRLRQRRMKALSSGLKEMTLRKLQFEILRLLGSYGHLINVAEDAEIDVDNFYFYTQKGFTTESRFLEYSVPFQDIKPDFYLDDFLPRLLETCHNAGDRQLRSTACEVFHAVVLYFIGHCSTHAKLPPFELRRRIFQSVIKLGCDSDPVIQQLFNPLALQIIRWYSLPNASEFGKTLLRLIVDGLVQSEDPPRRDFCTICLQEYFSYCLKHAGQNQQYGNNVLRHLVALSQHASPQYRQGSVLGFNRIYRDFREHRNFPNQYCFQLVYLYTINLSLSNDLDVNSMLIRTTKQALQHLERIIIRKKEQFNIKLSGREVPSDFDGSVLQNLVDWLLKKSACSGMYCRKECFRLISAFAPCIKGVGTLENYINQFDSETGAKKLLSIAEQCFGIAEERQQRTFVDFVVSLDIVSDFYSFIKRAGYPVEVLIKREDSKFVQQLVKFLDNFESELGNYDTDTTNIYTKSLSIFCSIGFLDNILSVDTEARIIVLSALVSAKESEKDPGDDINQIVDTWKKLWKSCGTTDILLDFGPKLSEIFHLEIAEELNSNRVTWLKNIAKYGFLKEMWTAEKVSSVLHTIWKFIDEKLFESCRTGLEERLISNRMKNLMEALFSLALELGTDGNLIVSKLFDPTIVEQQQRVNGRILKTTKGEVFQKVFISYLPQCPAMLDFTTLKEMISMEKLGQLVQKLLVEVKNKKPLRSQFGTTVVQKTIQIWRYLALNCSSFVVSGLISGLASLDMNACRNSEELVAWWCGPSMMTDVNTSLKEKSEFIHFLGLFGLSKNSTIVSKVMSTIYDLLESSLNSTLNWRDEENYLLKIFHVILTVFEKIPRNCDILNIIVLFTSKVSEISSVDNNSCSLMVKRKLEQLIKDMEENMEGQLLIMKRIYSLIVAERPQFRTTIAATKYCLLPIVASLSERSAKEFYKQNIRDLVEKARASAVSITDWNLKITALNLLESLILLQTSKLFFTSPELNRCYVTDSTPTDPKKLAKDIVNFGSKLTSPANGRNDEIKKVVWKCNQAAYNVMSAALIKMAGSLSIVNKIAVLLATIPGQWANVIDCETEYTFPVIFDQVLGDRENADSSRQNLVENNEAISLTKATFELNSRARRKNALAASSLAVDATNYDFTAAVTVNDSKYYQKIFGNDSAASATTTVIGNKSGDAVDWNHINQHDCMLSFTQCLRYLGRKQLEELNGNSSPDWIKAIKDNLKRSTVHRNIKLFFVGAILNCKEIFKPYGSELIEPIMNIILPNQQCFGPELNYFLKDVLVMLLEWYEIAKPSSELVKRLLSFIMSRVHHDRKDVYYQNLQIVEAIVQRWVSADDTDEIPTLTISELLKEVKPRLGLDLCKHILRGGQLPCKNELSSLQNLFKLVGKCFSNTSKPIYSLGGDVTGLLFSKLQDLNSEHLDDAINLERQFLDKEKKNRPPVFLAILSGIQKAYPIFALHYKVAILEQLKSNHKTETLKLLPGILQTELEQLNGGVLISPEKITDNFFADLEGRGLFRTSCKNDEEIIAGIKLLEQLGDTLTDETKVLRVINWVENAENSSSVQIQVHFATGICKSFFRFGGRRENNALSTKAMKLFVKLYQDNQEEMKDVINDFWEKNLKNCKDTQSLILELMEILGDEQGAVPICVNLIMKRCSLSPDYMKDIFKPLEENGVFVKYDLDTSWRKRYSTYQPLYAESISSSQNFSNLPKVLQSAVWSQRQGTGKINLLKATLANPQFSLTAAAAGDENGSFNMAMDQNSPVSFNPDDFFGEVRQVGETETRQDDSSNVLANLRKRFYDRPTQYYAQRQVEKQEAVVEGEIEDVREKRSGIKLVRSYRIGEVPDVVIKHSDFLNTISSLTKMDEEMGRKFLVHLFTNMVKELNNRDRNQGSKFCRSAATYFNSILQKFAVIISPQFAGAIIEIAAVNNLRIEYTNAQEKPISISINPALISETSRSYHLQRLAILQLEGLLEVDKLSEGSQAKRARIPGTERNEADVLLRIAELYKDLEDFDAVRNVFSMAGKASSESSKIYNQGSEALMLENDGKFPDARDLYCNLWDLENENPENYNERRAQFWDASVYKCLKQLSSWDNMYERTEQYQSRQGITPENIFTDLNYMDNILPHQITSGVQILVRDQSPEDDEPEIIVRIRKFLEEMKSKEENWQHFLDEYPTDFAVLSAVFRHAYGYIESLLDKSYAKSLELFQNFDKFSQPQKKEHLLKLQRTSVLQDYLLWYKIAEATIPTLDDIEDVCFKIIAKWKHCGSSRTSSLINTEIVVAQKDHFLTTIGQFVDNDSYAMLESKDHIIRESQCINYQQYLWLIELCIINGNSDVAFMAFEKASIIGDQLDETYAAKLQKLHCQYLLAFSERGDEWDRMWPAAWKRLRTLGTASEASLWEIKSDLLRGLLSKLSCGPLSNEKKVRRALGINEAKDLMEFAVGEASNLAETVTSSTSLSRTSVHMKLYNLLNTVKSNCEQSISEQADRSLQEYLLISLLRGMESGDSEALHLFPSTFSILTKFPDLVSKFQELVTNVPSWMFLPWLDQVIANWKQNISSLQSALNSIIDRLLTDYPQAFQLQYTDLLKRKRLPEVNVMYAEALKAIAIPSILFKSYLSDWEAALNPLKPEKLARIFKEFKEKLVEIQDNTGIFGDVHTDYAHKMLPKLESYEKMLQERSTSLDTHSDNEDMADHASSQSTIDDYTLAKSLLDGLNHIRSVSKELQDKRGSKNLVLQSLSPWLADFRSFLYQDSLEVPGLYTKFEKPNLEYHPKIMSFHPTVLLLQSLTKPIRITMRCDNGKEVHFLVKMGDDLNQDKRIQQCFHMANEIFRDDTNCRERNMRILTYSVIPFTSDFGMIQWIERTISLKEIIFKSPELEKTYRTSLITFSKLMSSFTQSRYGSKFKNNYHIHAQVIGREDAEKTFDHMKLMFPQGLMRKHVMEGCNSLEDYFVIREKMIRSYATLCFVHWILGIGDRHLENCLISFETGEFLGIDFGRAFGVAIFKQQIPELIPFRVTPQIQDFLLPYGCNGIFKEIMIYAHRSMKKSADLMSSVIDVFIKDPLVDWLKSRIHSASELSNTNFSVGIDNWDAIDIVNKKLKGQNPLMIIMQDMKRLGEERDLYSKILTHGKDEMKNNKNMTDEEYADALIAIATDKAVLIRLYGGWCSWI